MKRAILASLLFALSATFAYADEPATVFYVLKTKDVAQLEMKEGKLSDKDKIKLEDISICNGYFSGDSCDLYIKTEDYQTRVNAYIYANTKNKKKYIRYSFDLYSQKESKRVFEARGNIQYKTDLSIKKDWEDDEYIVIFRYENLKK